MAHTPGPWRVGYDDNQNCCIGVVIDGPDGEDVVAEVANADGYAPGESGDANARLIAAAPELLEALRAVCDTPATRDVCYCEDTKGRGLGQCVWCDARAAIAKATS